MCTCSGDEDTFQRIKTRGETEKRGSNIPSDHKYQFRKAGADEGRESQEEGLACRCPDTLCVFLVVESSRLGLHTGVLVCAAGDLDEIDASCSNEGDLC